MKKERAVSELLLCWDKFQGVGGVFLFSSADKRDQSRHPSSGLFSGCVHHLVNKRMVHEVRSPNAEIENINLLQDGVVESIQEPWSVWNLEGTHGRNTIIYMKTDFSVVICWGQNLDNFKSHKANSSLWRTSVVCTWLLVNTLKMCSSESGAKPWHSLILAITPATNVPWPRPNKQKKVVTGVVYSSCNKSGTHRRSTEFLYNAQINIHIIIFFKKKHFDLCWNINKMTHFKYKYLQKNVQWPHWHVSSLDATHPARSGIFMSLKSEHQKGCAGVQQTNPADRADENYSPKAFKILTFDDKLCWNLKYSVHSLGSYQLWARRQWRHYLEAICGFRKIYTINIR